jgi:hypothetical protein
MKVLSILGNILVPLLIIIGIASTSRAQVHRNRVQKADTVAVKAGSVIWIADSSFMVLRDTVLVLPKSRNLRIESNPYNQSDSFYKSIRTQANKNIVTKTLGNLVLISAGKKSQAADTADFRTSVGYFMPYAGKRLAHIRYKQVDVLAGSVWDTTLISTSLVSNTLNALHVKTKDNIIADNLLFQEGDTLQPLNLADTERILRSLPSIEDAKIYVIPSSQDTNDVSLLVVTKDIFSWGLGLTLMSAEKYRLRVINRNVLGWGAELKYALLYDHVSNPPVAHDFQYYVYNIEGSFISGTFNYIYSQKSQVLGLSFRRTFISPEIKYIGSLDLCRNRDLMTFTNDGISSSEYVKSFNQDLWVGRVLLLGKLTERNNLILSGRFNRIAYDGRPDIAGVQTYLYNNSLLLGRLSLAHINYFKSRMIYSFGRTEDVPFGFLVQGTCGYERSELANRYYFGSDFSWANQLSNLGYLGFSAEFGIFKHLQNFEQGVLNVRLLYLSRLINLNPFHMRQIIKLFFTNGINRSTVESLNLKDKLTGWSATEPTGKSNLIVNLENETFTPWYFYGFRFAFFAYADFALLSRRAFITSPTAFYSQVGLGCRLNNESLVFKTLNFRLGYFVRAPQGQASWNFEIANDNPEIYQGLMGLKPAIAQYR